MLALTFGALSFFGVFAINPTLSTIFELQKELKENEDVAQQLETKINNLSLLQSQFNIIEPELKYVYEAIPKSANVPLLSAQIKAIANANRITITSYRVAEVQLASSQKSSKTLSYIFNLQAEGNYRDMINFSTAVSRLNRIVTIESMSIGKNTKSNELVLTLRGRQYFKP